MSLLEHIPDVVNKDPELAMAIFECECSFMAIMAHHYSKKQQEEEEKKKKHSVWVRPYLTRRTSKGHYHNLMRELAEEDPDLYRNFMRLDECLFLEIVERVRPLIEKQTTWWREPLDVGQRVAITLRFLATGNRYKSIGYAFRVAPNTISELVPETCRAIITAYGHEVMKLPETPEDWKKVAQVFEERWNLPHAVGAIVGKHVRIGNPVLAGSHYYNYKRFYSMILMALVDADYKFMFIDVGAVGSESDAGVFAHSKLAKLFNNTQANLPLPEPLPGDPNGTPIDYFMVGDDAFGLRTWMMKPYPSRGLTTEDRVFNYRLSRGRRVVENAFGILASRFRVLLTAIGLKPDRAEVVIMACCVLHNLLQMRNPSPTEGDHENPDTHEVIPGSWRMNSQIQPFLQPLPSVPFTRSTNPGKRQRDYLKQYFSSRAGSVSWQMKMI